MILSHSTATVSLEVNTLTWPKLCEYDIIVHGSYILHATLIERFTLITSRGPSQIPRENILRVSFARSNLIVSVLFRNVVLRQAISC